MEYGKTCIPGRMAGLCKLLTVIDVKLFMVQSVSTRVKSINQSIKSINQWVTANQRTGISFVCLANEKNRKKVEKMKEAVTGVTGKRIFTDHWV
jgi:hypothetical protein